MGSKFVRRKLSSELSSSSSPNTAPNIAHNPATAPIIGIPLTPTNAAEVNIVYLANCRAASLTAGSSFRVAS